MSFRQSKVEVRTLTTMEEVLAEAKQLESYGGSESEREERERRETQIKERILAGDMTPFRWAVGHVPSLHLRRRVNGQHSSKVFLRMTEEEYKMVRFPVYIEYEEYECETEIDLATLFEQFDPHWSSRTRPDYIGAHLAVHPGLSKEMSRFAADKAVQGLTWYLEKVDGYDRSSAHEQFELLHKNSEYERFFRFCGYKELNPNKKINEMCHVAVVAAMFHTTRQGSDEDRNFWRTVAAGPEGNPDEDSHAYKLAVFLETAVRRQCEWSARVRGLFKNKQNPNAIEIFTTCLRVFAAWKKGLRLTEAFAAVRDQSAKESVLKLYPLKELEEVAA